jgi:hypothetical protein
VDGTANATSVSFTTTGSNYSLIQSGIPTGYKYLDVIEYSNTNSANNILVESLTATVTPEPASMALFVTGLLGIGLVMRKKLFA